MKLCWIVVLVGISIILVFLYSLVAMSSRTERFIEQLMEEEGRKDTDVQDMEANITELLRSSLLKRLQRNSPSMASLCSSSFRVLSTLVFSIWLIPLSIRS